MWKRNRPTEPGWYMIHHPARNVNEVVKVEVHQFDGGHVVLGHGKIFQERRWLEDDCFRNVLWKKVEFPKHIPEDQITD